jgi:cation diffusion facilitator family transporter
MHVHPLERWSHGHVFLGASHRRNERRTRLVIALTLAMMVGEVAGGLWFGSMALLADGWHMATHAGALAITAAAYAFARRHAQNDRYSFGTGKVGDLAGFTSALLLAVVAVWIGIESSARLLQRARDPLRRGAARGVLGLVVNLVSAFLLGPEEHEHDTSTSTDTLTRIPTPTTTCAPRTCTCSPTRSPRCSRSRACSRASSSA